MWGGLGSLYCPSLGSRTRYDEASSLMDLEIDIHFEIKHLTPKHCPFWVKFWCERVNSSKGNKIDLEEIFLDRMSLCD